MTNEQVAALEAMVDARGVREVLNALCNICEAKSNHIAENWQDRSLAAFWRKRAVSIMNTADKNVFVD